MWSIEDDERLYVGVLTFGVNDWDFLSPMMCLHRSASAVRNRWSHIVHTTYPLNYLTEKYGNYMDKAVRAKMFARRNEVITRLYKRDDRSEETPVNWLMIQAAAEQIRINGDGCVLFTSHFYYCSTCTYQISLVFMSVGIGMGVRFASSLELINVFLDILSFKL